MTTLSETELKELKELINKRFDKLEEKIQGLEVGQAKLETRLTVIENRLEDWKPSINKISDLAEKVGELKNWRRIALIIFSATVAATLGWFVRGGKF